MRFEKEGDLWLLVSGEPRQVIATIRSEVEVVALAEFCKLILSDPSKVPEHFLIRHNGTEYVVTPLGAPGEKLSLVVSGGENSSSIVTEFVVPESGRT